MNSKRLFHILLFVLPLVVCAQQNPGSDPPLYYLWKNVGNTGFSQGEAWFTHCAFSPSGEPFMAFSDNGNSRKATVMKFDGINWVNVGNAGFSPGAAMWLSFAFSLSGEPYVAYSDSLNSLKMTVMKFDGVSWIIVGNAGFSSGEADYISLALSPSGEPYVAFENYSNGYSGMSMKFDGINWVIVGAAGFSPSRVNYTSIAFGPLDGLPYIACMDEYYDYKAIVMKFNGTNWVYVGNPGFTSWYAEYISLVFGPSGQPYFAFADDSWPLNGKASVMTFDGTGWVYVGAPGFSAGQAEFTSLAFSPSGQPYVAYEDRNVYKATVMRFNGNNWLNVGNEGFSAGGTRWTSLAFDPNGVPFVGYSDDGYEARATVMKFDSLYVGVNHLQNSPLSIYPNPASKSIIIDIKSFPGNLKYIEIEDIKGIKMLENKNADNKTVIDIGNYPAGIYMVKVKTERTTWVEKFCKD